MEMSAGNWFTSRTKARAVQILPASGSRTRFFKRIPDALQNDCAKCSTVQRHQARRVLEFLVKHKRHYWDLLAQKYDPDGIFRKKHGIED
ncbi:hypothetical protein J6590_005650 [Homalodisca vitripennis]|nr:hypothetical protein J6590_005650 [Homalodisca vitripennis]